MFLCFKIFSEICGVERSKYALKIIEYALKMSFLVISSHKTAIFFKNLLKLRNFVIFFGNVFQIISKFAPRSSKIHQKYLKFC